METFELDAEQKVIKEKIFPYLKALTYELIYNQPENLAQYMIDFLTTKGHYTTSGLTRDEKAELELLRKEVKNYREMENHKKILENKTSITEIREEDESNSEEPKEKDNEKENSSSEDNCSEEYDDVMDEAEEEKFTSKIIGIKKTQLQEKALKQRVSVSAEVYGEFNKKLDFKPRVIPKTESQMNRIKSKIISSFIFNSLDKKDLDIIINAMEEKKFAYNDYIIKQGESGDCLYIIEEGTLYCYKTFSNGETKCVHTYGSGESFGELALLYNAPRAATVICASETCILWALDRETFNHIVKEAAQKRRDKYEKFLKGVDILSTIDSYELTQICDSIKSGVFHKDDYIIREGELGDVFYIIEEGTCIATKVTEPGKPETTIGQLGEGNYFGERALLKGEPRYANIVATSEVVKVLSLDRQSFTRLLGPIMDLLKRNMDKYETYCNDNKEKLNSSSIGSINGEKKQLASIEEINNENKKENPEEEPEKSPEEKSEQNSEENHEENPNSSDE